MALRTSFALAAVVGLTQPARAALVLEYVQVNSITAGPATGPALTSLTMDPNTTTFLQVILRDTIGSGPNGGAPPGTVNWQTNGGNAGPGSLGLGAFFIRFDGLPGVAVNPGPTTPTNARLVDGTAYGTQTGGTNPTNFTRIGGFLNFGFEPGSVPDPANLNRIPLFNLRVVALAFGSGTFRLRDPNPLTGGFDNSLYVDVDVAGFPNPGVTIPIDDLLFGPTFTNTYDLPVTVTPEPSSLVLAGLAAAGWLRRAMTRNARHVFQPGLGGKTQRA